MNSIADGSFNEDLKCHTHDSHLLNPMDNFQDAIKLCARNHDAKIYNIDSIKDLDMPISS